MDAEAKRRRLSAILVICSYNRNMQPRAHQTAQTTQLLGIRLDGTPSPQLYAGCLFICTSDGVEDCGAGTRRTVNNNGNRNKHALSHVVIFFFQEQFITSLSFKNLLQ